jgi:hypothetical protein
MADNLGWFGEGTTNIEKILKEKGEKGTFLNSQSIEALAKGALANDIIVEPPTNNDNDFK